jgi:hypothetical protein
MSGGIVQLVATGAQDAWLTGKPEVSFFRSTYRRYTHYANTVERQIIQGQPTPGGISTIRIEKKGDLLSYMYLTCRDTNGAAVSNMDWSQVIDKVELVIGGQVIDTQDFEYSTDIEPLTGAQVFSQRYLQNTTPSTNTPTSQKNVFYPFKFFFCKDWSVSLPLVALQFHDVELRITWSSNLGSTVSFGATTGPALGPPNGSIRLGAVATLTNSGTASNTYNLAYTSLLGPIFPGMLVAEPTTTLSLNAAVVQTVSVGPSSNVVVAFSNTSNTSVTTLMGANSNLYTYAPLSQAALSASLSVNAGDSTAFLPLANLTSYSGSGISVGSFVAGTDIQGPVVVTSLANIANSNIAVSFPTQPAAPAGLLTTKGTTISFFNGAATSTVKFSDLQFLAWANFVFLDETERNFFAKTTQDLLITQVNRVAILTNPVQELALAHPVKFLAFPCAQYSSIYANGAGSAAAALYTLKTQINGVDVGEARHLPAWVDAAHYYSTPFGYMHNNQVANVAVISYCLDTSKLQPTGTLNFSRLDTFRLITSPQLTGGIKGLTNPAITNPYLYAVNYNVLRIQNGLGGLLYAN